MDIHRGRMVQQHCNTCMGLEHEGPLAYEYTYIGQTPETLGRDRKTKPGFGMSNVAIRISNEVISIKLLHS